jgi:general L-amino acid transport system substrate-binding protein
VAANHSIVVALVAALVIAHASTGVAGQAPGRLSRIRQRGAIVCGVSPGIAGFALVDEQGRYRGLDIDVCRAVSAAIFGTPEKVRYELAPSIDQFLHGSDADLVSRRLTWSLQRDSVGLLFGPVLFYDGQGFLVPLRLRAEKARQLAGARICVVPGTPGEANLTTYFRSRGIVLRKVLLGVGAAVDPKALEAEFASRCDAFTADVTELGSLRSAMARPGQFRIVTEQISKEPLAPVVRQSDLDLLNVVRWTIFAMIEAEELGVTSTNVNRMAASADPDTRRLLGVVPGNGKALGLDEGWAADVIRAVGNYEEAFERNLGARSPIKLERGLNRLWTAGGLLYAPPLR